MLKYQGVNIHFKKLIMPFTGFMLIFLTYINPAFAQGTLGTGNGSQVNEIASNIITTSSDLPGLVTGLSYMLGVLLAALGLIKIREHVESPTQTPLRSPIGFLAGGGGLFALPTLYESMESLINGGTDTVFDPSTGGINIISGIAGAALTFLPLQTIGNILANIIAGVSVLPGFVTAIAYLLGLILGAAGVLKLKEHVEEPTRTPLREGIIRLVVGGMMFAIPSIFQSVYSAIYGSGGGVFDLGALIAILLPNTGVTTEGGTCITRIAQTTLGGAICKLMVSTSPMTAFLTATAYIMGTFTALWGVLKIKEHVENPQQTPITDPATKLLVAGGFFALPTVVVAIYNTVAFAIAPHTNTLSGVARTADGTGLDAMLASLMNDTFIPVTVIVNFFALVAGFILVFIGISRLMKSTQEGARGPTGIGTIMTFVTGGALLAFSPMITALSTSLFAADGFSTSATGTIQYQTGIDLDRAHSVLDAIILFVMLLGMISVARGIFIMRGVAEGNSQASTMAGVTHLIGGALAVNLGPFLGAVQETLGLTDLGLGITFG